MKKILSLAALCLILVCLVPDRAYSREAVFVHLDRQVFVGGETIRFSARLLDLNPKTDQGQSSVLYLQIADPDGRELLTVRSDFEVTGISYGTIELPDSLATGLYYLTAYTNCMRNYDPGRLWSSPIILIDRQDKNIDSIMFLNAVDRSGDQKISYPLGGTGESIVDLKITTDGDIFGKREKVTVSLNFEGLENVSSYSDISISVSELAPSRFLHDEIPDIGSFFKSIRYPQLYPEKAGTITRDQPCRYMREDEGYILSGTLNDKSSDSTIQNATVLLSTPDTIADLKYCFTDTTGRFYFLLDRCYNNRELILQTKNDTPGQGNTEIRIDDRSIPQRNGPVVKLPLDDSLRTFFSNYLTINLINNSFRKYHSSDENPEYKICVNSGHDFLGKPDRIIYPSDFISLPDFNEIIKNLMPYIRFKSDLNGTYTIQVPGNETHMYPGDENAFVLLNNIPLFDYRLLKDLNSKQINKIQVFQRLMMYGDLQISGIISINTDIDFLPFLVKEKRLLRIRNEVVKRNKGLILSENNDGNISEPGFPDLRQTLYWDPQVSIKGDRHEFEFYTSDLKASYEIKVQGLTDAGIPVYATKVINIQ